MPIENIQLVPNNNFDSTPAKNQTSVKTETVKGDEDKKRAANYMIGATILASVVALGVAGYNGKLGSNIQKILGGKTKTSVIKNLTPQQKAQEALSNLYDKVINKAQKEGNTKRVAIFEQCKNNISSLDAQTTYANLLDALYKDLRLGEYPTSSLVTKNIEDITSKGNKFIKVKNQNGWHYRMPIGRKSAKSVDRISVNALADEKLIQNLDDLFASGKVKGYYKTPETSLNWLERHDPITIYLDEKADTKTLEAVKTACEKYIRSSEDVLSGKKFASGMALQKSPDEQDIKAILQEAKNVDSTLEYVLRTQFTDNASGKLITSAGYMDSAKKMIDLMKYKTKS